MAEKMLVTQALDERDAMAVKIRKKIQNFNAIAVKRKKDDSVIVNGKMMSSVEFEQKIQEEYQSLNDCIARYDRIVKAITLSNATTMIELPDGKKISVAQAIGLRTQLANSSDFKASLLKSMKEQIATSARMVERLTDQADNMKDRLISSVVGKDRSVSTKESDNVEAIVAGEYPEVIDPVNITELFEKMTEERHELHVQINTLIKVSNATTEIEF